MSAWKIATGIAHSKLILIGEHAVVYGCPAIALPFHKLKVTCTIEAIEKGIWIDSKFYAGPIEQIPERLKGLAQCINYVLKELKKTDVSVKLTIRSEIPIGRGLGSSAAIALAIVRALAAFLNKSLATEQILNAVNIAETYAHGNPSGIDMEAVFRDVPIWFEKGKPIETLVIQKPFLLVVADTGRFGDTKTAVQSIKEKLHIDPIHTKEAISLLGQYTVQAREALRNGETKRLGCLLNNAHSQLDKLGVSDEELNQLVLVARKAGALGAKLTGGGRGGCIIGLVENVETARSVSEKLLQSGAEKTWILEVEKT